MAAAKTLEDIITEQASIVCEQIEAAVSFAESEEDLRIEFEKAIEVFRKEADLPELKGHHEVTIGKGRADSVYDYVFIEYKKPGRLKESNDTPGNREVIKQLQERAKAFKSELKRDPKELFGVGTDGNYFITGRYRSGRWEINPARGRSVHVVEDFLRKLSSLGVAGKPFLADYLAGDFGAENGGKLAREGIGTLYRRIREVEKKPDDNPKANVLFDQWRILFGEVCGYDIKNPTSKIKQLGEFYGVKKDPNAAALLFAVHSYYALFMKFLAAEIATMFNPLSASFLARLHQTGSSDKLREELRELEDGGIYRHLGIKNFLEGDLFSWYLDAWDENVEKVIRQMVAVLDEYDPKTLSIDPVESRDLLKKLYQQLFPKTVRHDLGEYYTPDWLAQHVLNEVGYEGDPEKRLLDPACGSGTFLVMAINKVREYAEKNLIPKHELLPKILNNIVGFDLNPLAVMAARTNYLLALRELLKLGGDIEIPVYLCDSIMTPAEYGQLITKEGLATGGLGNVRELKTSAARFMIPTEIVQSRQTVAAYAEELERCVRNDYTDDEFISRLKGERVPVVSEGLHKTLYRQVHKLKKQKQNDIWARIIKNSFAPLFIEHVDYVVGNPPWINWEHLPEEYRSQIIPLYEETYGLFPHVGLRRRHGSSRIDISTLLTYVSADRYLKSDGKLGFLITESVFSTDSGKGFRRMVLPNGTNLCVYRIDDMVTIKPFEGVGNRTAAFFLHKGRKTQFPIQYVEWSRRAESPPIPMEMSLSEVMTHVVMKDQFARPIAPQDPSSEWAAGDSLTAVVLTRLSGGSDYKAHAGVCTWLNAVYWVRILAEDQGDNSLLIENVTEKAKIKVPQIRRSVESTHIFPLIRPRDMRRWFANPAVSIIIPQDPSNPAHAMQESVLKTTSPKTYEYLSRFRKWLERRPGYKKYLQPVGEPFYALYDIKKYTFVEHRVIWRRIASRIDAVVISTSDKPKVPQETVILVPVSSADEAHYLCSCLNSLPSQVFLASYSQEGGKSFASTQVVSYLKVPKYQGRDGVHRQLAEMSRRCHAAAAKGELTTLGSFESQIDKLAARLWGITPKELEQIQKALKED